MNRCAVRTDRDDPVIANIRATDLFGHVESGGANLIRSRKATIGVI